MRWKLVSLILLGTLVFLWLVKAPLISVYVSHSLRLNVSMGWLSIGPHKTSFHNFEIKNPKGFTAAPAAFLAKTTLIDYNWGALWQNPLILDTIVMEDAALNVEVLNATGSENNWTALSDAMTPPQGSQEVIITKLILENLTVNITGDLPMGGPIERHFDRLEFDNVSSKKGFPTEALVHKMFDGAGLEEYIEEAFNPGEIIEGVINPFRSL